MVLVAVGRLEELVFCYPWVVVLAPAPRLGGFGLELLEKMGGPLFQPLEAAIGLECGEQTADIFVRPAKIVLDGVLANKLVRILPALLDNSLVDDHIA